MTQGNRWRCLLRNGRAMEPLQGEAVAARDWARLGQAT